MTLCSYFAECARRTQRQFVLEDSEVGAVARICRMVQGMPLAIELAAASVRRRSCAAIAVEIEASLRALAGEWRDAPERHRSVWAAFEHSWQTVDRGRAKRFPPDCLCFAVDFKKKLLHRWPALRPLCCLP